MALTVQIVGHKNSGKTLVTTRLTTALTARGLRVAAIKHDAHEGRMDQPGTDTWKMTAAGASPVFLQSRSGTFSHQTSEVPLATLVDRAGRQADLVIIEGHKAADYPKLVLLTGKETPAGWAKTRQVIAWASCKPNPTVDLIGPDQVVTALINWITTHLKGAPYMKVDFTHFNQQGRAKMVDVTDKKVTSRIATATGQIKMQGQTLTRIHQGQIKKGDVLAVAQVAGIMAAKHTADLIPMCHLIPLTGVDIHFESDHQDTITATATVKTKHVTGVEIEALLAVQTALLTIYDMCKAIDRGMVITKVHLVEKDGGKSGHFLFHSQDDVAQ